MTSLGRNCLRVWRQLLKEKPKENEKTQVYTSIPNAERKPKILRYPKFTCNSFQYCDDATTVERSRCNLRSHRVLLGKSRGRRRTLQRIVSSATCLTRRDNEASSLAVFADCFCRSKTSKSALINS